MKFIARLTLFVCLTAGTLLTALPLPDAANNGEELQIEDVSGQYGGRLAVGQRAEPKTLNPVIATDSASREVIGRMMADLIDINRATQRTQSALAKSWTISRDGRIFTLRLRKGIRFSDGHPFDADDVLFSFTVYMDPETDSPQRDLLMIYGKPIVAAKVDQYTVKFTLPRPYAAAERLFDGFAILPRHLLEKAYREKRLVQAWSLNVTRAEIAGLGPFRLKEYIAGQRIVLERNPYYWKADRERHRLPYLDELVFLFVASEDAQVMRFEGGETGMISRLSAENFALLLREQARNGWQLSDLGPSLEYNFLLFNLNDLDSRKLTSVSEKQAWFRELKFRQAVSLAVDRDSIVRLVYGKRGAPLWGNVGPGNKLWANDSIPHPKRSLDTARQLLKSAGFIWNNAGQLLDGSGKRVEFSIMTSSSNTQRMKMATLIQDDLSEIGIQAHIVPMEFRALLDRLFQSLDYEAAIMGLGGGDADPNPEMNVWLSTGSSHLWHLGQTRQLPAWEQEVDRLMQQQMVTLDYQKRKQLYDHVQELISENVPFIFLATPNALACADAQVGNFRPAVLDPYTLWNADELYLKSGGERAGIR